MIENGMNVKDKVTGFKGVVVGVVNYISGCNQALVVPKVQKDGKLAESQWIDVQRLEQTDKKVLRLDNGASPGCDVPAPKR